MKISNNALNFLLAQYRAIFKRAYVKGIASAVLLTAGLAAGQAQASAVSNIATINNSTDEFFEIDGEAADGNNQLQLKVSSGDSLGNHINIIVGAKSHYIQTAEGATAGSTVILDAKEHNITISDKDITDGAFDFGSTAAKSKLQIKNLGTLTISGAKVNLSTPASGTKQAGVDVGAKELLITGGAQVNLNNNIANSSSSESNIANTFLRATKMTIEGDTTEVNIGNVGLTGAKGAKNSKAVFGYEEEYNADGSPKYQGSDIKINDATLNFYGAVVGESNGAKNPVLGGTKGYVARIQGKTLEANNAVLTIHADHDLSGENGNYGGAGATYNVHKSTLTNSHLTIEDQATLNLELREFNKDAYYKEASRGWDATGRDYNGSLTIDGGVVVIDGVLRHTKGGLLEIKDGTQLTGGAKMADITASSAPAKNENKLDNAIFIGVYGNAANPSLNNTEQGLSGSFANSKLATLRLSSTKLDEFLNSKDEVITDKDDKKITDNQGQLVVHHGAHIEFTDQQQVEMSKFVFDNDAGAGHISTAIAQTNGSSTIGGDQAMIGNPNDTVPNEVDGTRTIMAQNMSIGKSLLKDASYIGTDLQKIQSGNSSLAFRFEANDLTLGSEKGTLLENKDWAGFDSSATSIGAYELKAHKSITFIDGHSDTFYLQDDVVLDTTLGSDTILGTANDSNTGTLKGDDVVIGYDNDTTSTAGSLKVAGGAWTTEQGQSIKVADGSLTVSARAGTEKEDGLDLEGNNASYYAGGVATSLVINGGSFIINKSDNGTKADVTVTGAKGATALLDLRNTSVTWGSGSITVTGAVARNDKADPDSYAGEGVLYVNNAQFKNFINGEKPAATQLTLGKDGVLAVEDSITSEINVGTFVTDSAKAGKVFFSGAGTLTTNGALTIAVAANDEDGVLAIGDGTIEANQLTLNNHVDQAKSFVVSGGTLEVAQNLSSNMGTVEFKTNSTSGGILVLDREGASGAGTVGVDLKFDGAQSKLNVAQGDWSAAGKNAYFSANATFAVGDSDYDVTGTTASLSLANLNTAATSSVTSNIYQGSTLTVDTMQAGANSVFAVNGEMTIKGRSDIDSGSDSKELAEVKKAAKTAGINLAEATFNVTGTEAALNLGTAATDALISFKPTSADPKIKEVKLDKALSDAKINLTDFARLNLEFSDAVTSSEKLTAANAQELKDALNVNDSVDKGIINVGNLALAVKWTDEQKLIAKWDDVKEFANVESVTSDQLQQALITDVTGQVAGHFGAMQTSQNAATAITVDGTLGLHAARGDFFAFTMENGEATAVGAHLAPELSIFLGAQIGSGNIGHSWSLDSMDYGA